MLVLSFGEKGLMVVVMMRVGVWWWLWCEWGYGGGYGVSGVMVLTFS